MTPGDQSVVSEEQFRAQMRTKYARLFKLCGEFLAVLEGVIQTPRPAHEPYLQVQDLLFLQSFKAAQSILVLAELALVEDAATIARRLLELAMRALYIEAKEDQSLRQQRVEAFLARLWHGWPVELRAQIPAAAGHALEDIYQRVTIGRKDGQPPKERILAMFEHAGATDLYREDYALLSDIAHGTPPMLVANLASSKVRVHDDRFVPAVVKATLKYLLIATLTWNAIFELIPDATMEALLGKVNALSSGQRQG